MSAQMFCAQARAYTPSSSLAALDTPGLLANIGEVFQRCDVNIHAAKITTIGERAEDFFMISNSDDQALSSEQQSALKRALIEQLSQQTEG